MLGEGEVGLVQGHVFSMNYTRVLTDLDEKMINELGHCHKTVFPDSMLNVLGDPR